MVKKLTFFIALAVGCGLQAMEKTSFSLLNPLHFIINDINQGCLAFYGIHAGKYIASVCYHPYDQSNIECFDLLIDPDYQEQGLTKQLILYTITTIIQQYPKAKVLFWEARPFGKKHLTQQLERFYISLGGKKVGATKQGGALFRFDLEHLKKTLVRPITDIANINLNFDVESDGQIALSIQSRL